MKAFKVERKRDCILCGRWEEKRGVMERDRGRECVCVDDLFVDKFRRACLLCG